MNRKKFFATWIIVIVSVFLIAGPVSAQAEKIGFIDMKEIIFNSDAGKAAAADFKRVFEKKKAAIQHKESDLKKQKEALDKQRSVLKEEAFKEKEMEYQRQFREYQRLVSDSNEDLSARDQQLSGRLIPEIMKIVQSVGVKEGYTLILDVNNPIVVYHSKTNQNLTKRIVSELNKKKGKR